MARLLPFPRLYYLISSAVYAVRLRSLSCPSCVRFRYSAEAGRRRQLRQLPLTHRE